MAIFDRPFILLHISIILLIVTFLYIYKIKQKKQIHYAFLGLITSMLIWSISTACKIYINRIYNVNSLLFNDLMYVGLIIAPVFIFFVGKIFAYTRINFNLGHKLLLIIPILSIIIIPIKSYLFISNGPYFIVHAVYSYGLIIIGLYYLAYFSIKNSGFFSKQSLLIIIGCLLPLIVNVLLTIQVTDLPFYSDSIAFSFAAICWMFAIFKFDFLNVVPIALQRVVDLISDSYVVLNENLDIIDYNKTLINTFESIIQIKRKDNFIEILKTNKIFNEQADKFGNLIRRSISRKKPVNIERHVVSDDFDKYFTIEVTPIFSKESFLGTIILFKDITQHKKNIQIIKETQNQLVEKERLASLGQLIGGIAHNLKTPIMSLSGGLEGLDDLIKEYDDSIDDKDVTSQDHHEIAKEMSDWIVKMKPYLSYMSDIITTVKDQAVQLNAEVNREFTIDELVKRIDILMKHELKRAYCKLNMNINIDKNVIIKGEINNFIQVVNNLIVNAIHAYEGKGGEIDFNIDDSNGSIEFVIKDYGKGISVEVRDRLFKEMVTTKGKNGTGLGLYMSYSTIKGKFGGDMRFESAEGKGTTFYITIPTGDRE